MSVRLDYRCRDIRVPARPTATRGGRGKRERWLFWYAAASLGQEAVRKFNSPEKTLAHTLEQQTPLFRQTEHLLYKADVSRRVIFSDYPLNLITMHNERCVITTTTSTAAQTGLTDRTPSRKALHFPFSPFSYPFYPLFSTHFFVLWKVHRHICSFESLSQ